MRQARKPIPDRCKPCRRLWTGGIKDGKNDRWCTFHSQSAPKIEPHCRIVGGYEPSTVSGKTRGVPDAEA